MVADKSLVNYLQQVLPGILQDTPVTLAYLYGSAAVGQMLPISDVDIALVLCNVEANPVMLPTEQLQLEFAVERALEQQGLLKPDVRIIDNLPLAFRGQVAIQGIRLFSRDEIARVEFETRTWKEYLDFEPVIRMMRQSFFKDVQEHGL